MFTVKLGAGKTFAATAVDERYQPGSDYTSEAYTLTFEGPAEKDLEEYVKMCSEAGALETVEVSANGETVAVYTGYDAVGDVSVRLLTTGQKNVNIRLSKKSA